MTKKEIYEAMGGRISMSSIGEYSDEYQILGKYGMVSWMDGYWDVWINGLGKDLSIRVDIDTGLVDFLYGQSFQPQRSDAENPGSSISLRVGSTVARSRASSNGRSFGVIPSA